MMPLWKSKAHEQADRFWSKADTSGSCWMWTGGRDKDGYGRFAVSVGRFDGRQRQKHMRAHRLAYVLSKGAIPTGKLVLHSCDQPGCVNPDHLRVGTQKQNRADAVARGRVPSGMLHHSAKLSRSDVIEIRKRRANGEKLQELADSFGITFGHVSAICKRQSWRHV